MAKIRKGFVSNSSSSSFVCEICEEIESGMDLCLSEVDMVRCSNGHEFHADCADFSFYLDSDEDKIKIIKAYYKNKVETSKKYSWHESDVETLKNFEDNYQKDDFDIDEEFDNLDDLRYEYPSEWCPICNLKRTKDSDIIKYMYKKFNTSKDEITKEIKGKFNNLDELNEYLKK